MIRAISLSYIALIFIAVGASGAFGAEPSQDLPPRSRLPRSISSNSASMHARARILVLNATRDEFKLSETQAQQVDDFLREWSAFEEQSNRKVKSQSGQSPSGITAKREETQKYLERIQDLLMAEQNRHLNRLVLKAGGLRVFLLRGPISAKMKLTDEQRKQVFAIYRDRSASKDSQLMQFLKILTSEQRRIWDELAGRDFVLRGRTRDRRRVGSTEIPGIRSPAKLLRKVWVQRDLKLTAEQATEIDALFAGQALRVLQFQEQTIAGAQVEALQEQIEKLRKSTDESTENLLAVISAPQLKRLDELVLQDSGPFAFQRPDVHKRLDLNRQQMTTINKLLIKDQDFVTTKRKQGSEDEAQWIEKVLLKREQLLRDALLLLTPVQLQKWKEIVGPLADQSPDAAHK